MLGSDSQSVIEDHVYSKQSIKPKELKACSKFLVADNIFRHRLITRSIKTLQLLPRPECRSYDPTA